MLDESLPTFYLRASTDDVKHHASVLLSYQGSEATPTYSLRHPDPALPASRNRYASALYDSYQPEILYGEVLLIPEWSKPNLTKEELRLANGVPPPPQPILPAEFVIQLYNPDQQVHVKWNGGSWNTAPYWSFEMPQQTFRQPSASALDRVQSDPTASENTPKLEFKWKKDGKLSKDYLCTLSGKSSNPDGSKKKGKEPDITIAIFKAFKELTVYEPNLSRVDVEDKKGLEVVLLLGAIVIREVFTTNMSEAFNISEPPSSTAPQRPQRQHQQHQAAAIANRPQGPQPPPTDARTQWEIDAEAARLKKQSGEEERRRRRAEEAETKRVKKMLEEEDRQKRERQKQIDRETERLKKLYGKEQAQALNALSAPSYGQPQGYPATQYGPAPVQRPHSAAPVYQNGQPYLAHNLRPPPPQGPYLQPPGPGMPSSTSFLGGRPSSDQVITPKKSFWHFGKKDQSPPSSNRLSKQRSGMF